MSHLHLEYLTAEVLDLAGVSRTLTVAKSFIRILAQAKKTSERYIRSSGRRLVELLPRGCVVVLTSTLQQKVGELFSYCLSSQAAPALPVAHTR